MECENKNDTSSDGSTETVLKSLRQYLSNIPGKHEIRELQISRTGHCTQTAESANVKDKTYFTRETTLHVAQIVNTEQLQRCIP